MSMFFFKLITLIIRTIAKPMVSWVSHYNKLRLQQQATGKFGLWARSKLIWLGQTTNYYNIVINRKLFKISTNTAITSLTEEKALERGAEAVSEFLVYSILIILPIAEMIRQSKMSKQKEAGKEKYIIEMKFELEDVIDENGKIKKEIDEIKILTEEILNRLNNKLI
jgi:hypothetical protein